MTIRVLAAATPFVAAWFTIAGFSDLFIRPSGTLGLAIWLVQAFLTGVAVSMASEHFTRRLLPLASLFNMTLVFPDRAPSRFSVALRSSTVKRLQTRHTAIEASGLGKGAIQGQSERHSDSDAAANAIEMIGLLSSHDRLTRGHTERVRAHAVLIAEEMGISAADRDLLTWGAMLHDIGKLTVSPEILNKPGKPTDEEWQQLKGPPGASAEMLAPLQDWLGDWALAASQHHERWDGTGYPAGLAGTEISMAGRITAVADAYDVITSKRSYKKPMSVEAARQELIRCAGSQFDPDVVRAFLNISLRHRWASGPLASLTELPKILNLGANLQSTAVIVAGTAATVGSVTLIPAPIPQELASTAPARVEVVEDTPAANEEPVELGQSGVTLPVDQTAPVSELPVELQADAAPLSTEPTAVPGASSSSTQQETSESTLQLGPPAGDTAAPTTTASTATTSTRTPATTNPTTTNPTTATSTTAGWSPTTSTAPTTTTTAAPTTTTAPATTTTTTAAPTTTTTAPTTSTTTPGSPLAVNDSESVKDNKDVSIPVLDNDDQGNSAFDEDTLEILSPPSNAKDYRVHNDHIHYKSEKDYEGTETIVYRICNNNGLCDTGLITIEVTS